MRTTVKTFLVFVLLMVTYSLSSRAVNFTGMVDKAASTCEVSTSSSSLKNASSDNVANNTRSLFTNSKFMWTTDAELGNKPISERYSFNPYRFRRAVETASFMKGILLISSHHNLLVHDQSKLYYSDKDPHYTSFSSEYSSILCGGLWFKLPFISFSFFPLLLSLNMVESRWPFTTLCLGVGYTGVSGVFMLWRGELYPCA